MTRLTGHYDGKVIVLDGPVDLPTDRRLVLHVEPEQAATTLDEMLDPARKLDFAKEDVDDIARAIEEDCEQVNPDEW